MIYGSVCSGIEAATVAWHPLGWRPAFFSEIEKFPRQVLGHHYPDVPCHGDFLTIKGDDYGAIDLLVGGTPCQSFSVAGLRKGMDDPRGNLALGFLGLLARKRPRWVVWENVPGVLSSNKGRDFGAFLGGLGKLGYGWAYRVLDAQYFGVAQRRRRVFVVGYSGGLGRSENAPSLSDTGRFSKISASVLFERQSLRGDSAPSRSPRKKIAGATKAGFGIDYEHNTHDLNDATGPLLKGSPSGGGHPLPAVMDDRLWSENDVICMAHGQANAEISVGLRPTLSCLHEAPIITVHGTQDPDILIEKAHTLGRNTGQENAVFDPNQITSKTNRSIPRPEVCDTLPAQPNSPVVFPLDLRNAGRDPEKYDEVNRQGVGVGEDGDPCPTLSQSFVPGVAISEPYTLAIRGRGDGHQLEYRQDGTANALLTPNGGRAGIGVGAIGTDSAVRRLTPRECERLQGFPDDYTRIPIKRRGGYAADGPRYKSIGNSMAVPVMHWIGERIRMIDNFLMK